MEKKILRQFEWSIKVLWPISYRAREYWRPNCFSFCLIHITGAPCFSDSASLLSLSIFRSLPHLQSLPCFSDSDSLSSFPIFLGSDSFRNVNIFTKFHLISYFRPHPSSSHVSVRHFRTLPPYRLRPRHFQSHSILNVFSGLFFILIFGLGPTPSPFSCYPFKKSS